MSKPSNRICLETSPSVAPRPATPGSNQRLLIATALAAMAVSQSAHAYLDPGTGSILLQGLIAAVAAGIGYAGMYWQRVKGFFGSLFSSGKHQTPDTGSEQEKKQP